MNELGSSPAMKPSAVQVPSRPYAAGGNDQSPRAGPPGLLAASAARAAKLTPVAGTITRRPRTVL